MANLVTKTDRRIPEDVDSVQPSRIPALVDRRYRHENAFVNIWRSVNEFRVDLDPSSKER